VVGLELGLVHKNGSARRKPVARDSLAFAWWSASLLDLNAIVRFRGPAQKAPGTKVDIVMTDNTWVPPP